MRDYQQLEVLDGVQGHDALAPGLDVPRMVRSICQTLAAVSGAQRVDITLESERNAGPSMPLGALWARQAKDIAREWDLTMYIRLQAGILRLTFIKPRQPEGERQTLEMQNGNQGDRTD